MSSRTGTRHSPKSKYLVRWSESLSDAYHSDSEFSPKSVGARARQPKPCYTPFLMTHTLLLIYLVRGLVRGTPGFRPH